MTIAITIYDVTAIEANTVAMSQSNAARNVLFVSAFMVPILLWRLSILRSIPLEFGYGGRGAYIKSPTQFPSAIYKKRECGVWSRLELTAAVELGLDYLYLVGKTVGIFLHITLPLSHVVVYGPSMELLQLGI